MSPSQGRRRTAARRTRKKPEGFAWLKRELDDAVREVKRWPAWMRGKGA